MKSKMKRREKRGPKKNLTMLIIKIKILSRMPKKMKILRKHKMRKKSLKIKVNSYQKEIFKAKKNKKVKVRKKRI